MTYFIDDLQLVQHSSLTKNELEKQGYTVFDSLPNHDEHKQRLVVKNNTITVENIPDKYFLEDKRAELLKLAEDYGNSFEVDKNLFNGVAVVVDALLRTKLRERIARDEFHKKPTHIIFGDLDTTLPTYQAKQVLGAISDRAAANYDIMQNHLKEIKKINNLQALNIYDYRANYLNPLEFTI